MPHYQQSIGVTNFQYTGEVISAIWSPSIVDRHLTVAEYIQFHQSAIPPESDLKKSKYWMDQHVRASQYFTQVVNCFNFGCWSSPCISYFNFRDTQFLPVSFSVTYNSKGLAIPTPSSTSDPYKRKFPRLAVYKILENRLVPSKASALATESEETTYHSFCPYVRLPVYDPTSKKCHLYFASKVMLQQHVSEDKSPPTVPVTRVRPQRTSAHRQREFMVIIAAEKENAKSVDWFKKTEVDFEVLLPEDVIRRESSFP